MGRGASFARFETDGAVDVGVLLFDGKQQRCPHVQAADGGVDEPRRGCELVLEQDHAKHERRQLVVVVQHLPRSGQRELEDGGTAQGSIIEKLRERRQQEMFSKETSCSQILE